MNVATAIDPDVLVAPPGPPEGPHVHVWELREVEFDTWGQVSLYECVGCPRTRFV